MADEIRVKCVCVCVCVCVRVCVLCVCCVCVCGTHSLKPLPCLLEALRVQSFVDRRDATTLMAALLAYTWLPACDANPLAELLDAPLMRALVLTNDEKQ